MSNRGETAMYINPETLAVYSGDKAHWKDVEATSERPSIHHDPVLAPIPDDPHGRMQHTGWVENTEKKNAARIEEIKELLIELDRKSIRPLRAIADGTQTEADVTMLNGFEAEAKTLRDELAGLLPTE